MAVQIGLPMLLALAQGDMIQAPPPLLATELAATLLRPDGAFGIDATLIDADLLGEAVGDSAWGEDVRWASDEFGEVRRESRLLPDPAWRACRHRRPCHRRRGHRATACKPHPE